MTPTPSSGDRGMGTINGSPIVKDVSADYNVGTRDRAYRTQDGRVWVTTDQDGTCTHRIKR